MSDDARRPARLQGRAAAEDARINAYMHTSLAGDACRETLGMEYDGEDGIQRLSRHDRSLLLVARCTEELHAGLMVLVEDTDAVEIDPSMSARPRIT